MLSLQPHLRSRDQSHQKPVGGFPRSYQEKMFGSSWKMYTHTASSPPQSSSDATILPNAVSIPSLRKTMVPYSVGHCPTVKKLPQVPVKSKNTVCDKSLSLLRCGERFFTNRLGAKPVIPIVISTNSKHRSLLQTKERVTDKGLVCEPLACHSTKVIGDKMGRANGAHIKQRKNYANADLELSEPATLADNGEKSTADKMGKLPFVSVRTDQTCASNSNHKRMWHLEKKVHTDSNDKNESTHYRASLFVDGVCYFSSWCLSEELAMTEASERYFNATEWLSSIHVKPKSCSVDV